MGEGRRRGEEHKCASGSIEIGTCAIQFTMWATHGTGSEEESMAWENAVQEEVDELWKEVVRRMEKKVLDKWSTAGKGQDSQHGNMRPAQID